MNTARERNRPKTINAQQNEGTCWKRRLVIVIPFTLLLLGPTPGAVGSCNQDEDDNRVLDVGDEMLDYCQEKEELTCVRRGIRGELDGKKGEVDACRDEVRRLCETRYWAPACRPTQRQAKACVNALKSMDTIDTEESEIKECSQEALCTVRYEGPEPSDLDAGEES